MTERKARKAPIRRKPEEKAELAEAILNGMAVQGLSCFKACEAVGVPIGTFSGWVADDRRLAERYAHAREALIERLAAETLAIADAPVGSTEHGTTDGGAVQKQRLQVDTRKWLLSKLAPKKYGDKVTLAGDEMNPVKIEAVRRIVIDDTDADD